MLNKRKNKSFFLIKGKIKGKIKGRKKIKGKIKIKAFYSSFYFTVFQTKTLYFFFIFSFIHTFILSFIMLCVLSFIFIFPFIFYLFFVWYNPFWYCYIFQFFARILTYMVAYKFITVNKTHIWNWNACFCRCNELKLEFKNGIKTWHYLISFFFWWKHVCVNHSTTLIELYQMIHRLVLKKDHLTVSKSLSFVWQNRLSLLTLFSYH